MKKPFIISISGLSGSGKTTVSNALRARLANAAVVLTIMASAFISTATSMNGRLIRATMKGILKSGSYLFNEKKY